ncbi:MAG: hypothetical protein ACRDUY_06960 [Nitriliruptorales bacterium]
MLSSISPVGEAARHQRWGLTVTAYLLASTVAGGLVGAGAGGLGEIVTGSAGTTEPRRLLVLALVALVGLALDRELGGLRLPTWRRQVDENWLTTYRGWVYGAGFGFQLGLGFATTVTRSVTYVAFAGAALSASWEAGLLVGATFGATRGLPLLLAGRLRTPARLRSFHRRLAAVARPADRLAGVGQASVAVLALLSAGALR